MKKPDLNETRQEIRANIFADAVVRGVRWLCFAGIVCGLVLPLAWHAFKSAGALVGLVVLALALAMAWTVKPQGASYGRQCREIEARYPPE